MIIKTNNKIFASLIAVLVVYTFFSVSEVKAATNLSFKADSPVIKVGNDFSVDLKVSSDKSINVVRGTILYDFKKVNIERIETDKSIISMWQQSPIFDNHQGRLSFVGGIINGFSGQDGEILKINFSAKNSGEAKLDFEDIFSVYQNDGLGTQINPILNPMSLTIIGSADQSAINNKSNNPAVGIIIIVTVLVLFLIGLVFVISKKRKK